MRGRWTVVAYVIVAAVWVALRASVFSTWRLIEFPDSESYLIKATEPLWDVDYFVGSGRFFVVPAFYKLVFALNGPDKEALTSAQFLLSLASWIALGWSVATQTRPGWLSVASFSAVLAFGLSTEVIQWDVMVLSESLSTSLFALLVAVWIRLSKSVSNARVAAVIGMAMAWSLSREANSLLLLPLAIAALVWGLWFLPGRRREQVRCAVLCGALVATFVGTAAISGSGDRWVFPLLNVIGKRVLPSAERTAFYQSHGMPMNAKLMEMSGEFASGKNWAFYGAPELQGFRVWLHAEGKGVFARDLASNPVRTFLEPLENVEEFVCPVLLPYRYEPFPTLYSQPRWVVVLRAEDCGSYRGEHRWPWNRACGGCVSPATAVAGP